MLEKSLFTRSNILYGLLGAVFANVICSFGAWMLSVSSVSIFGPVLISNMPVVLVLGCVGVLLFRLSEGCERVGVFWLTFFGMLVAFPAAFWMHVFILKQPTDADNLALYRIYIGILEIGIGAVFQAMLIISTWIFGALLRRHNR